MTDLLDIVRDLNPVPSCEQPSLEAVWRRLERERRPPVRARRGLAAAIAAVAVVLVVAGARAGVLGRESRRSAGSTPAVQRLAEGTIRCDFASVPGAHGAAAGAIPTRGRSAIAYCRGRYETLARGSARASDVAFVACQTSATSVTVYLADGRSGRCRRLGDRVLPAGYAAAVRRTGAPGRGTAVSGTVRAVSV